MDNKNSEIPRIYLLFLSRNKFDILNSNINLALFFLLIFTVGFSQMYRKQVLFLNLRSYISIFFLSIGTFNPYSGDPLPAFPKKQLILKIISGQQLPKPPDSMLGDRGEVNHIGDRVNLVHLWEKRFTDNLKQGCICF